MQTRLIDYLKALQTEGRDLLINATAENEWQLTAMHYMIYGQNKLIEELLEKARKGDFGED